MHYCRTQCHGAMRCCFMLSNVSFTKMLCIITHKLTLLEITEFSSIINLFSLTIVWMRTAIIWVIRLLAWNFIVFTRFNTETWADFIVHVLSFWLTCWLDCAPVSIFTRWTANFRFIVTIAFTDHRT